MTHGKDYRRKVKLTYLAGGEVGKEHNSRDGGISLSDTTSGFSLLLPPLTEFMALVILLFIYIFLIKINHALALYVTDLFIASEESDECVILLTGTTSWALASTPTLWTSRRSVREDSPSRSSSQTSCQTAAATRMTR